MVWNLPKASAIISHRQKIIHLDFDYQRNSELKTDVLVQLFGCGINTDSQLGPQYVTKSAMALLSEPVPIPFPAGENGTSVHIAKVAAGRAHTIIVTNHGTVYSTGEDP